MLRSRELWPAAPLPMARAWPLTLPFCVATSSGFVAGALADFDGAFLADVFLATAFFAANSVDGVVFAPDFFTAVFAVVFLDARLAGVEDFFAAALPAALVALVVADFAADDFADVVADLAVAVRLAADVRPTWRGSSSSRWHCGPILRPRIRAWRNRDPLRVRFVRDAFQSARRLRRGFLLFVGCADWRCLACRTWIRICCAVPRVGGGAGRDICRAACGCVPACCAIAIC